jgi:predicted alpha/beta-hydrolase family hydrolase
VLEATVRAAVAVGARVAPDLPRFAGGKSMGGRMTSRAAAAAGPRATGPGPQAKPGEAKRGEGEGLDVLGIVFAGFPLHAAGAAPSAERATHLADVLQPMLFLQGTRDALADLRLMRAVCEGLGERATLHVVDGADHGFHVPKRSGKDDAGVIAELADATARWIERTIATG